MDFRLKPRVPIWRNCSFLCVFDGTWFVGLECVRKVASLILVAFLRWFWFEGFGGQHVLEGPREGEQRPKRWWTAFWAGSSACCWRLRYLILPVGLVFHFCFLQILIGLFWTVFICLLMFIISETSCMKNMDWELNLIKTFGGSIVWVQFDQSDCCFFGSD